jgi:hypothetical protein
VFLVTGPWGFGRIETLAPFLLSLHLVLRPGRFSCQVGPAEILTARGTSKF